MKRTKSDKEWGEMKQSHGGEEGMNNSAKRERERERYTLFSRRLIIYISKAELFPLRRDLLIQTFFSFIPNYLFWVVLMG